MASVVSQLIEDVTARAQSDGLEDAREICADRNYFPNNPRKWCKFILKLLRHVSMLMHNLQGVSKLC